MRYLIFILAFISAPLFAAQGNMDSSYVIYNVDDGTFLEKDGRIRRVNWPTVNGGPLGDDFPTNLRYLEITEGTQPPLDPATEKLTAARVVDLPNTEWRREYTVVPLTQEELDRIAENEAAETEQQQARDIYLELKNVDNASLNTDAKVRAHVIKMSKALARLIRDSYGE